MRIPQRAQALLIPALSLLLAGCAVHTPPQGSEDSNVPAVTETVPASTEAAATSTKATSATAAVTTAAPETSSAVSTTREIVFRHRAEILSTALLETPLTEEYEQAFTDPERLEAMKDYRTGKAGRVICCCAGPERDCVYFTLERDWKRPDLTRKDIALYRLDEADGSVTKLYDNNGKYYPFDGFILFPYKDRMFLAAYSGLYLIDEENCTLKELDGEYSPFGPNLYLYEDRLILPSPPRSFDPIVRDVYEYDPETESMVVIDEIPGLEDNPALQTWLWSLEAPQTKMHCTGDSYDNITYVFEWE